MVTTKWGQSLSKWFLIPQRYILGIMGFLAIVNAYTMRISLSIAITEMVKSDNSSSNSTNSDDDDLYDWDSETKGLILSSFYWGYILTHIPGGLLAEKFGGKYSLGLGILSTAIFTLITPAVVRYTNGSATWLIVLRVLEGLGEGTTYPALGTLLSKWVPLRERARIGALVYAGSQIGTVVSNLVSGALIHATKDWSSVFYLFGSVGILWFIIWTLLCYSEPATHPFISDKEKAYLERELSHVSSEKLPTPWKAILLSPPVISLVIAQIGHDWGFFTMVTDLPLYMKDVLNFEVAENGIWSSLPYIVMWIVSMSSGWICDRLIRNKVITVTFARKFFTTIAAVGPGIFIVAAAYVGDDRMVSVAMFTIAMGIMGVYYCGMRVNALDISPNFAGTVTALVNGIGAVSGIFTPYLVGALTPDHTQEQWQIVFWIALGMFVVTVIVYDIFASGEVQWWNEPNAVKPINSKEKKTEKTNYC